MEIRNVFVIGSGAMGTGIAQVSIQAGYTVTLRDISMAQLEKARANIEKQLQRSVDKGRITAEEKDAALARLTITETPDALKDADLVIEAASEKAEVKMGIFKEVCSICSDECILATNTSSISITKLSGAVSHPERVIGMHFFNPVPVMKLLEIVRGLSTSEETIAAAREVGEKLNKVIIVSADSAGFIVNRLLDPMINEAFDLIERGVGTPEDIDKGCKYGLNWPMGPCELIDMAGIDIELAVMETIYADTGDSKYRPSPYGGGGPPGPQDRQGLLRLRITEKTDSRRKRYGENDVKANAGRHPQASLR